MRTLSPLLFAGLVAVTPAHADGQADVKLMHAAAVVLSLVAGVDGQLAVDSGDAAHLAGSQTRFERVGECAYAIRISSVTGDKFHVINFRKLSDGYGHGSGGAEWLGWGQSNCWRYRGQPLCSGVLHVPNGRDEGAISEAMAFIHRNGCPSQAPQ